MSRSDHVSLNVRKDTRWYSQSEKNTHSNIHIPDTVVCLVHVCDTGRIISFMWVLTHMLFTQVNNSVGQYFYAHACIHNLSCRILYVNVYFVQICLSSQLLTRALAAGLRALEISFLRIVSTVFSFSWVFPLLLVF